MPTENNQVNTSAPSAFIGLQSYTESQASFFFGRDNEIDALTSQINLNPLTIVFGKSGTGKTSLLNAGVFPKIRKSFCLPFRIRLEFQETSPDLITQIKTVLKQEIDKYGFKVESYPATETLWEYFHKEPLWKTVTPILVFDQFEEIFTLAKSNPRYSLKELPVFWEELSYLAENNIPEKLRPQFLHQKENIGYNYKKQKIKIVFAFREEYLPEFEHLSAKIPSLKTSRFRLLPMNGHQAFEVITKNWKQKIQSPLAKKIVSYLTNEPNQDSYDLITVEPSLLSQVCTFIDKERINSGSGNVTTELLDKFPKETILRSIYEQAMEAGKMALPPADTKDEKRNLLKEFVEEKLITADGHRIKHNLSSNDEAIRPGLIELESKYLVREDDNVVELTHDVLAPIIREDRVKRTLGAEKKKARRKALLIGGALLALAVLGTFITLYILKDQADTAIKERDEAKAELLSITEIHDQLKKDTTRMGEIYRGYLAKEIFSSGNNLPPNADSLNDIIDQKLKELAALKKLLSEKNIQIQSLTTETRILRDTITQTREVIVIKTKQYDEIKAKLDKLQSDFNNLDKKYKAALEEIKDLRRQLADIIRVWPQPVKPCGNIDSVNCLKLDLNYKQLLGYYPSLRPQDIKVFLIPYTSRNMKTIKASSVYDTFDEGLLTAAEGRIIGIFCAPYYIFPNVEPGKYLLKVCTLYGTYETYVKNSKGSEVLKLDAVMPVKMKDR